MNLRYWIQRADLSVTDFPPVDAEGACRAYAAHNWRAELRWREELDHKRKEQCQPGIGLCMGRNHLQSDPRQTMSCSSNTVKKESSWD